MSKKPVNRDAENYATHSRLGKSTDYQLDHSIDILDPIERSAYRATIEHATYLTADYPVTGFDRWYCYELSWLDNRGKPLVGCAQIDVPLSSSCIVESKSLKLYLNSLNHEIFVSVAEVQAKIAGDLQAKLSAAVSVSVFPIDQFNTSLAPLSSAVCLDTLEVECRDYHRNPELLLSDSDSEGDSTEVSLAQGKLKTATVYSHLFRSNCPVTHQPDWATVYIQYNDAKLSEQALLRYLVSYREHNGFHEQCIEQIYCDILHYCSPKTLSVWANFTRRGGIDINPVRCYRQVTPALSRTPRQ